MNLKAVEQMISGSVGRRIERLEAVATLLNTKTRRGNGGETGNGGGGETGNGGGVKKHSTWIPFKI